MIKIMLETLFYGKHIMKKMIEITFGKKNLKALTQSLPKGER